MITEYFSKDHILKTLHDEYNECLADPESQMRYLIQRIEQMPPDLIVEKDEKT